MSEWRPIETAPTGSPDELHDPPRIIVWVAGMTPKDPGRSAFGRVFLRRDGSKKPRADGFLGDYQITHWQPDPGDDPPQDRRSEG